MIYEIRPAEIADSLDIMNCWKASFSDSEELIQDMLFEADLIHSATVAECEGAVRSVMFAFDGQQICQRRASYLYALCTHPDYRKHGLGTAVCEERIQESIKSGNHFVFLSPATEALFDWYCNRFHMNAVKSPVTAKTNNNTGENGKCFCLNADSFFAHRKENSVLFSLQLLRAQEIIYRYYSGGFFLLEFSHGTAIVSAYLEENVIFIQELILSGCSEADVFTTLAMHFGLPIENCQYYHQSVPLTLKSNSNSKFTFFFPYSLA